MRVATHLSTEAPGIRGVWLVNVVARPRFGFQELTHFAALVPMFLGFLGTVVDSSEGMLGIPQDLGGEVIGLGHRLIQLLH